MTQPPFGLVRLGPQLDLEPRLGHAMKFYVSMCVRTYEVVVVVSDGGA
jgi:hypothetical protein